MLDILKASGSFDVVFFISAGGPYLEYAVSKYGVIGATTTISYFIFEEFYRYRNVGLAAAYSVFKSAIDISMFALWYFMCRKRGVKAEFSGCYLFALFSLTSGIGGIVGHRYLGLITCRPISIVASALSASYVIKRSRNTLRLAVIGALLEVIGYAVQLTKYELWYAFDFSLLFAFPALILYAPRAFGIPRFRDSEAEFRSFIVLILTTLIVAPYNRGLSLLFLIFAFACLLGCGRNSCAIFIAVDKQYARASLNVNNIEIRSGDRTNCQLRRNYPRQKVAQNR